MCAWRVACESLLFLVLLRRIRAGVAAVSPVPVLMYEPAHTMFVGSWQLAVSDV